MGVGRGLCSLARLTNGKDLTKNAYPYTPTAPSRKPMTAPTPKYCMQRPAKTKGLKSLSIKNVLKDFLFVAVLSAARVSFFSGRCFEE